jgi:hypothetical protein
MKNSNAPAFGYGFANEQSHQEVPGLTKREYFAAMAMQGLLSIYDRGELVVPNAENVFYMAELSVTAADALLKQLEKEMQP